MTMKIMLMITQKKFIGLDSTTFKILKSNLRSFKDILGYKKQI